MRNLGGHECLKQAEASLTYMSRMTDKPDEMIAKLRNRAQSGVTEDTAVPALRRMRQKDFQSSKPAW